MKSFLLFVLLLTSMAMCAAAVPQNDQAAPENKSAAVITHGPVVEGATDTTASIAWTTSVNAGTIVKYGFDPAHLDFTAEMPWGGITHRVHLKELKPATTYYFQALSPKAQGSGTDIESSVGSFTTQAALGSSPPQ